ncbi:MAG: hypothetical protein LUC93_07455 [Planctomycetaceae bacterium]|nr:hypothetical protein [Planctomycetaceae bacterium]
MKKYLLLMFAATLFSLPCWGAAMEEYEYLDGVYTFSVPKGWTVVGDEDNRTGVTISPREDMESHILFYSPNPHVDAGDLDGLVGGYLMAKFASFGGGEVDEAEVEHDSCTVTYSMKLNGKDAFGVATALMKNGYAILIDVQGPVDDEKFIDTFDTVIDSLELNSSKLKNFAKDLDAIGKKMLEQLAEAAQK